MAKKIGIIYCERIQDASCVGCAKCYKSVNENTFAFENAGDVQVVFKCGCGDCPGLMLPKIQLMNEIGSTLDREFDTIHFGTCILKALKGGECPLNLEKLSGLIKENFGKETVIGTHNY